MTNVLEMAERDIGQAMLTGKHPEDGAELLADVRRFVKSYVVLSDAQADAVTLWVAHTHAVDQDGVLAFEATPYLHITSPEKQSGKTRLLETLEGLVFSPWHTSRTSIAALVRKVGTGVTLLLDETDRSFQREKEYAAALVQILDDGYRRGKKATLGVPDGKGQKVADLPVFGAKAFAGLGRLPDTVEDRAIEISMKRRGPNEKVERFRFRDAQAVSGPIRAMLAAWAQAHLAELTDARPYLPDELSDRQQDRWEPLLAIADLTGGDWPQRARRAAVTLAAKREDSSQAVTLLDNIQTVFEEGSDPDRMTTAALLEQLNARDDWPWGVVDYGKPLNAHRLAAILKPFGIGPSQRREGGNVTRGYDRAAFFDAWTRYLSPTPDGSGTSVTNGTEERSELHSADGSVPLVPPVPLSQDLEEDGTRSPVVKPSEAGGWEMSIP